MFDPILPPGTTLRSPSTVAAREALARLDGAARTADALRARLARVLADGGREAPLLERLHQDLLQGLAAARLMFELGRLRPAVVTGPAAGAFGDTLDRFERLAPVWLRLASSGGAPAPDESSRDLRDLFATELAVRGAALDARRATDRDALRALPPLAA